MHRRDPDPYLSEERTLPGLFTREAESFSGGHRLSGILWQAFRDSYFLFDETSGQEWTGNSCFGTLRLFCHMFPSVWLSPSLSMFQFSQKSEQRILKHKMLYSCLLPIQLFPSGGRREVWVVCKIQKAQSPMVRYHTGSKSCWGERTVSSGLSCLQVVQEAQGMQWFIIWAGLDFPVKQLPLHHPCPCM